MSGLLATDYVNPSVDLIVTELADSNHEANDPLVVSLRDAIDAANTTSGAQTIWLPAWHFQLTHSGDGDLDVTSDANIVGTGAGSTIIDAGGSSGIGERVFDVHSSGDLDLSRVTVTGGYSLSASGGGIRNDGILLLSNTAVVSNTGRANGAAIQSNSSTSDTTILNSVITNNYTKNAGASNFHGGAIYAHNGQLEIGNSIVASNTVDTLTGDGAADIWGSVSVISSTGDNLLEDVRAALIAQTSIGNDYFGSPDYVVTGLADTYDDTNNDLVMSIRDAIHHANNNSGTEEIWLPAWDFVLTIDRGMNPSDTSVAYGDLDIAESLIIRGAGGTGGATVDWRPNVNGKVFELLGDSNSDGWVNIADWIIWRDTLGSTTVLAADGDDDGTVDNDDEGVWSAHFNNTLDLLSDGISYVSNACHLSP